MLQKADPMTIRMTNRSLILRNLYYGHANTRSDLSKLTGLTRTAISDVVASLIKDGFIREVGYRSGLPGKPPMLLEIPNDAGHVIGIQIELGYIQGIICDLRGNIVRHNTITINSTCTDKVVTEIRKLIDELLTVESKRIIGIGISSPGIINTKKGIINYAANLGWRNFPLKQQLESIYDFPIHLANDTICAGLAEKMFGMGKEYHRVCTIVVEAGVGAGIIISDEQCVEITNGSAEIGHLKIYLNKRSDLKEDKEFAIEELIGKKGLMKRLGYIAKTTKDQDLIDLLDREFDAAIIAAMAKNGNKNAEEFINEIGYILGKGIAVLINLFHPNVIILSGAICGLGETLISRMWNVINVDAIDEYTKELDIVLSGLNFSVILGAAAQSLKNELGII